MEAAEFVRQTHTEEKREEETKYHIRKASNYKKDIKEEWMRQQKDHRMPNIDGCQSYVIKSAPWTILWFRILGIFFVENIKRLCVFMFQTCSNSQLLRRVL